MDLIFLRTSNIPHNMCYSRYIIVLCVLARILLSLSKVLNWTHVATLRDFANFAFIGRITRIELFVFVNYI